MTDEQSTGQKSLYFTQREVEYAANGGTLNPRSQACSTCRWLKEPVVYGEDKIEQIVGYHCHIVEGFPAPIVPNGWCNQWTAVPEIKPEPMEVVIVDATEIETGQMSIDKSGETAQIKGKSLVDRVLGLFKSTPSDEPLPSFKALGNGYWFAAFTNNFQDRDKEILSRKAHEKYVRRVQLGLVDMPELWIHHIPGTRHGKALYVGMTDHTVFAVGKFDNTPLGALMEKTYSAAKPGTYGLSHGFTYPNWARQEGVYHDYNTFEITTLLPQKASNPYTPFMALPVDKEIGIMPLNEDAKQKIQTQFPGAVGENILKLVAQVEEGEKQVKDLLGAKYKDFADATDKTETKASDTEDAVKSLIPGIMEGYGDLHSLVKAMDKRLDAQDKTIATLTTENTKMQAALALKPEPASQSEQTLVDKLNTLTEAEKKELAAAQEQLSKKKGDQPYASIFPDLVKQS